MGEILNVDPLCPFEVSQFPLEATDAQSLFCVYSFKMFEIRRLGSKLCLKRVKGLSATTIQRIDSSFGPVSFDEHVRRARIRLSGMDGMEAVGSGSGFPILYPAQPVAFSVGAPLATKPLSLAGRLEADSAFLAYLPVHGGSSGTTLVAT